MVTGTGRRFRARCLFCPWVSEASVGPVFAGGNGLKHVKLEHPEAEGFVVAIEEVIV